MPSRSAVLIHGDILYVGTDNGVDNKGPVYPEGPSLIALNKRTGQLVARDDARIVAGVFHGQWSSPSLGKVGDKHLIFFGGGNGVVLRLRGPGGRAAATRGAEMRLVLDRNPPQYRLRDGKPIDYWDGSVRMSDDNKNDGTYVGPSEIIATPVFYKNRVYVAIGQDPTHGRGRGMLNCIDATGHGDISRTGKIWTYDQIDRSLSTVAIAGGLL